MTGLSNEDAARYAFLLATPIIAAAGVLKLPELLGSAGDGVRGQALVGALAAAITTCLAVKFLLRFFETNRLTPFGIYCIVAGASAWWSSRCRSGRGNPPLAGVQQIGTCWLQLSLSGYAFGGITTSGKGAAHGVRICARRADARSRRNRQGSRGQEGGRPPIRDRSGSQGSP